MDFVNPKTKYELLVNKVPRVFRAIGDHVQNLPIVCGDRDEKCNQCDESTQDCVVVGQPEMEIKMTEKRYWTANVAKKSRLSELRNDNLHKVLDSLAHSSFEQIS